MILACALAVTAQRPQVPLEKRRLRFRQTVQKTHSGDRALVVHPVGSRGGLPFNGSPGRFWPWFWPFASTLMRFCRWFRNATGAHPARRKTSVPGWAVENKLCDNRLVFPGQAQVEGVELAAGGQFAVVTEEQGRMLGGQEGQARAEIDTVAEDARRIGVENSRAAGQSCANAVVAQVFVGPAQGKVGGQLSGADLPDAIDLCAQL